MNLNWGCTQFRPSKKLRKSSIVYGQTTRISSIWHRHTRGSCQRLSRYLFCPALCCVLPLECLSAKPRSLKTRSVVLCSKYYMYSWLAYLAYGNDRWNGYPGFVAMSLDIVMRLNWCKFNLHLGFGLQYMWNLRSIKWNECLAPGTCQFDLWPQ